MMVDLTPAEAGICLLAIVKAEFAAGWESTPRPWGAASRGMITRLLAKLGIPDTEVLTLACPVCGRVQRVDRTAYLCGVEGAEREDSLRKGGGESGAPSSLSRRTGILYAGGGST